METAQQEEKEMTFRLMNLMNWIFWLGALALILISVTSCNEVKLVVNTDIESPLRNTCQSGDLDSTFPKCHLDEAGFPEREPAEDENLTTASVVKP